ncbi:hypothetical protein SAMN02745165_00231 [Malonomonas rubra DSM 5091]|uniref:Lipoprotein n=1 Tax=Malonomonas rubra DSM 5091 TaxID=1122189 RepID=A0A1M6BMK9_MALRU|nr:hypothetical protein [Malonomonas rubra]SHI49743.1 hypothetical protein SAMN02745165_00231 [Malonomonas rubra DSM 5091]
MGRKLIRLLLFSCIGILLTGCISSVAKQQPGNDVNEQLYIDARLSFAIKHPLNWERLQTPVSSPKYSADTVRWEIKDLQSKDRGAGVMLIRSRLSDTEKQLTDLLSNYLSTVPELESGKVEKIELPSGDALKLLGHDKKYGRLTIAIKGQERDFILSLEYPSSRFDELLPFFQDIANSFTEIVPPAKDSK